ncbi:MAG: pseudaminic acid synthase, partial [Candidatus Omnitrophica bacterium]|nr:pseudaminic acid synthase [Candidatus Omnitrophota bacterium]
MINFKKIKNCFIVAEISSNHGQSFPRAVKLIKKAKECGVNAVKFQAYTPDTLTINANNKYFQIRHSKWGKQALYQLYQKAYTPWGWFKKLKKVADDAGITFFSTSFDKTAVDFLEELNVPFHKISSFELVDLPLIEYVAKTKKPLFLSTGMASISEIKEAVAVAKKAGAKDIILLKCVSNYPARFNEMNLKTIPHMKKLFQLPVGLSDHTLGITVPLAAVTLGAMVVEKHFTLSKKIKTPDSFFSLEPGEMKMLVDNIRIVEESLGEVCYGLTKAQENNYFFRRSIFVVQDMEKGEKFNVENIKSIRPGYGMAPKYERAVLGKRAKKRIKRG